MTNHQSPITNHQSPAEDVPAVAVHLHCERCDAWMVFEYRRRGRAGSIRRICDACRESAAKENQRQQRELRRLRQGEGRAVRLDGLRGIALRSQDEVAQILGVTKQAVQGIERRILARLARDAELKAIWRNEKSESGNRKSEIGKWTTSSPRPSPPADGREGGGNGVRVEKLADYECAMREWRSLAAQWRDQDRFAEAAEIDEATAAFAVVLQRGMERGRKNRKAEI